MGSLPQPAALGSLSRPWAALWSLLTFRAASSIEKGLLFAQCTVRHLVQSPPPGETVNFGAPPAQGGGGKWGNGPEKRLRGKVCGYKTVVGRSLRANKQLGRYITPKPPPPPPVPSLKRTLRVPRHWESNPDIHGYTGSRFTDDGWGPTDGGSKRRLLPVNQRLVVNRRLCRLKRQPLMVHRRYIQPTRTSDSAQHLG